MTEFYYFLRRIEHWWPVLAWALFEYLSGRNIYHMLVHAQW